jgi:hypothetical protein
MRTEDDDTWHLRQVLRSAPQRARFASTIRDFGRSVDRIRRQEQTDADLYL